MVKVNSLRKIILIMITILLLLSNTVFGTIDDIIKGGDDFIQAGSDGKLKIEGKDVTLIRENNLRKVSDMIFYILLAVAIIGTVIQGIRIGLTLVTAAPTEKAEAKESLIPFLVGCFVIYGAFGIWKLVVTIIGQVIK